MRPAKAGSRLARFEEEARALAALNHPHVGAIYGLEERRLMVPPGGFPYVIGDGTARLTARR